jgi:hypothetical protein
MYESHRIVQCNEPRRAMMMLALTCYQIRWRHNEKWLEDSIVCNKTYSCVEFIGFQLQDSHTRPKCLLQGVSVRNTRLTCFPRELLLPKPHKQGERERDSSRAHNSQQKTTTTSLFIMQGYSLKKRRPGCTGMFWRPDPSGKTRLASNDNWPRDGAQLRGTCTEFNGKKWLAVSHVKQAHSSVWIQAPEGAFIPFEYDNHYYLE